MTGSAARTSADGSGFSLTGTEALRFARCRRRLGDGTSLPSAPGTGSPFCSYHLSRCGGALVGPGLVYSGLSSRYSVSSAFILRFLRSATMSCCVCCILVSLVARSTSSCQNGRSSKGRGQQNRSNQSSSINRKRKKRAELCLKLSQQSESSDSRTSEILTCSTSYLFRAVLQCLCHPRISEHQVHLLASFQCPTLGDSR